MSIVAIVRRFHLWAGVLLGVQVILWMLSGVVMSWYHIDLVRGDRQAAEIVPLQLDTADYISPARIIDQAGSANEITLRRFLGQPVYETSSAQGAAIYDALNGERLSPISEEAAREVVRKGFAGSGKIAQLQLIEDPGSEMRGIGPRPIWRAQFDDRLNTRIYVSPDTGAILRRRNDVWRFYDFFWMLHIMDYQERHDFNNPMLRVVSFAGLLFSLSGLAMIFFRNSRSVLISDIAMLSRLGRRKTNAPDS